jgi:hypothetical protein
MYLISKNLLFKTLCCNKNYLKNLNLNLNLYIFNLNLNFLNNHILINLNLLKYDYSVLVLNNKFLLIILFIIIIHINLNFIKILFNKIKYNYLIKFNNNIFCLYLIIVIQSSNIILNSNLVEFFINNELIFNILLKIIPEDLIEYIFYMKRTNNNLNNLNNLNNTSNFDINNNNNSDNSNSDLIINQLKIQLNLKEKELHELTQNFTNEIKIYESRIERLKECIIKRTEIKKNIDIIFSEDEILRLKAYETQTKTRLKLFEDQIKLLEDEKMKIIGQVTGRAVVIESFIEENENLYKKINMLNLELTHLQNYIKNYENKNINLIAETNQLKIKNQNIDTEKNNLLKIIEDYEKKILNLNSETKLLKIENQKLHIENQKLHIENQKLKKPDIFSGMFEFKEELSIQPNIPNEPSIQQNIPNESSIQPNKSFQSHYLYNFNKKNSFQNNRIYSLIGYRNSNFLQLERKSLVLDQLDLSSDQSSLDQLD